MSDSEIQVDLGTGGVYVDTSQVTTSEGQPVQRQRVAIGDASAGENFLGVGADGASSVHVISTPTAGSVSVNNFPATQVVSGSVSVINGTNAPASVSVLNFPSSTSVAGSVSVNNFPSSFIVSNLPAIQPVSQASNWGASISNLPANQTVSGSVSVLDFPSNQVVSGSVGVTNFPAFPAVQAVSGSVSVLDFPATQNVAGSVSVLDFPVNQVVSGSVSVTGSVNANVTDFPAVQAVSGSVTAIPYGVQTVSGSVSVLNPSSGGGSASVSILNSALLPVADAAAEASLAIMGIPNINKGKCAGGTLVAGAAGVTITFQGNDTFTANELVIANLTGAAPVAYTLDGTTASLGGNVGAAASVTNGQQLSALSTLTFTATTGLWGTSGIGTIVASGGTHTFTWTGQSGSTLTGCVYGGTQSDTVATAAVITQLANATGCIPSIGADIIPCNTTSPTVNLASTGVPQYLVIVRGA